MVEAGALWLAPGAEHPVYARFARFFRSLFRRFEVIDYRAAYLQGGAGAVHGAIAAALERGPTELVIYSQFPSTYAYLSPADLRQLSNCATVVGLGFDDEMYFESSKFFYLHCDALITTDIPDAERLREAGVAVHFAQLTQPQVALDSPAVDEDIDVSFVGDMTKPGRRELIGALEAAGIAVADYGNASRRGPVPESQIFDIFRRSRINLNFTRTNPPAWVLRRDPARAGAGQIKARPFELASLGKFCLSEWAPCVGHWFQPGEEIGVFRDSAELVTAVKKYLENSALRARIAAAAQRRYRAQYEPQPQFERIFSKILADRREPPVRTPAAEPVFYESIGRSRASAFLHTLRRGRPLRALREPFSRFAAHPAYWRGFAGGIVQTLAARLGA